MRFQRPVSLFGSSIGWMPIAMHPWRDGSKTGRQFPHLQGLSVSVPGVAFCLEKCAIWLLTGGSIPCHDFPCLVLSGTYATGGLPGVAFCVEKCVIWHMTGGGLPCHDFPCLVLSDTYVT